MHPVWENICRRKTNLLSHQLACQLVGFVAILDPLRVQSEVEPWSVLLVARAVIASASVDIDHAEDIGATNIYTTTRKYPPQKNNPLVVSVFKLRKTDGGSTPNTYTPVDQYLVRTSKRIMNRMILRSLSCLCVFLMSL